MAARMSTLTHDLIVEILLYLPATSLARFRCVCKTWRDLIKNPDFVQRHLKISSTRNPRIVCVNRDESSRWVLSLRSHESLELIGSMNLEVDMGISELNGFDSTLMVTAPCNGLICVADSSGNIALLNPALGERNVLNNAHQAPEGYIFEVLAIGFGYDSISKDYKVVTFVCQRPDDDCIRFYQHAQRAVIYSRNTNSWQDYRCSIELSYLTRRSIHVPQLNGALHWIYKGHTCNYHAILCFNLSTERFSEIRLPDTLRHSKGIESLTVIKESLALFVRPPDPPDGPVTISPTAAPNEPPYYVDKDLIIDIWVMQEYGAESSWTRQVRVRPGISISRPLLLWKNEALLMHSTGGRLCSFALDTREVINHRTYGSEGAMEVMVYHESLVSIA